MINNLHKQAINQALAGNWKAAVDLNLEILKLEKNNIDALCRLAKAYAGLGKKTLVVKTYRRVLRLDKFNPIAKNNLVKFLVKKGRVLQKKEIVKIDPSLFLEEPGKTKVVALIGLGLSPIILELNIGDPVSLMARKHVIAVYDQTKRYLGKIPDDLSLRLIKLIKSGNLYQSVVKAIEPKALSIFIKEIKQNPKNRHLSSFPFSKEQYYSFASQSTVKSEFPKDNESNPEEL